MPAIDLASIFSRSSFQDEKAKAFFESYSPHEADKPNLPTPSGLMPAIPPTISRHTPPSEWRGDFPYSTAATMATSPTSMSISKSTSASASAFASEPVPVSASFWPSLPFTIPTHHMGEASEYVRSGTCVLLVLWAVVLAVAWRRWCTFRVKRERGVVQDVEAKMAME